MAEASPARLFLFFLAPVFGVLALSYLFFIGGAIVAITGWVQVAQIATFGAVIPTNYQWSLYLHGLVFTSLALMGIFGATAASMKRPVLVSSLAVLLAIEFISTIISGSFMLSLVYSSPTTSQIQTCLNSVNTSSATAVQICFTPIQMSQGVVAATYIICWLLVLYASYMAFSFSGELNASPDIEKRGQRPIDPLAIGHPVPLPNHKPATMSMIMGNNGYPISIIDGLVTPTGMQQHSWDGQSMIAPRKAPPPRDSPPNTPVTPSRPDAGSGMKPLMLPKPLPTPIGSPQFPPPGLNEGGGSTTPRQPLPGQAPNSAGLHPSYTFTNPDNSFYTSAKTPTQATFGKADRI